jgi:DNA polymerase-3 subunit epsilon
MSVTIVLDFETTGISPGNGARTTEVGAVRIEDGRIVDAFQSLMNAGVRIPRFIERYTGITNAMVRKAPPAAEVMAGLARFIGEVPLVAHNASFDRRFLDAELARIGLFRRQDMACSVLVARRVYPDAPSYKLGALVRYLSLPNDGVYHRALADATLTAHLWLSMQAALQSRYRLRATPFALMKRLQQIPKREVASYLRLLSPAAR